MSSPLKGYSIAPQSSTLTPIDEQQHHLLVVIFLFFERLLPIDHTYKYKGQRQLFFDALNNKQYNIVTYGSLSLIRWHAS